MSAESAVVSLMALTAAGFIATNLDNLLLLVALSSGGGRARAAVGFLLAAVILLGVATLGMLLGDLLNPAWVGYLGIVPLAMGLYMFWKLIREPAPEHDGAPQAPGGIAASVLVMLSNSGDNLALFLPLMADTQKYLLVVIMVTYAGMALAWTLLAGWLVQHRLLARSLERHGRWILPCIMVFVGSFVLMDTGYDRLPS